MAATVSNGHAALEAPKITLFTNHSCPYAHRAHITLKELGLHYDEVIIDLDSPREPWYLEVNPRGLVPSIKYTGNGLHDEIVTESAVVAQLLADLHSTADRPLSPPADTPAGALKRARIAFFTDTWDNKVSKFNIEAVLAETAEEKEVEVKKWLEALEKEIEPQLRDANPYFGGSDRFTIAEVHVAPFLVRAIGAVNYGLIPKSLIEGFDKLPNFSKWYKAAIASESVRYVWDEEKTLKGTIRKIPVFRERRAKAKA